jgi:hypothetical protein
MTVLNKNGSKRDWNFSISGSYFLNPETLAKWNPIINGNLEDVVFLAYISPTGFYANSWEAEDLFTDENPELNDTEIMDDIRKDFEQGIVNCDFAGELEEVLC